jgi:drug/metabolite transporter (DMT)-like permease
MRPTRRGGATAQRPALAGATPDLISPATVSAYVALCLIWGSTFLALRIAVQTLPPWTMIGLRALTAGGILAAIALARGAAWPDRAALRRAGAIGFLLFTCSQAMLAWGELRLPSGTAAVLGCSASLFTPIVSWLIGASPRPGLGASAGLLLGFAGVAVLIPPTGHHADGLAILVVLASAIAWAFGAALARRAPVAGSALLASGLQLVLGGLFAFVFAGARGEWTHLRPTAISAQSVLALLYLIIAGSLVAFACFGWLVRIWQPERLSTYAYVNPVVALALGAVLAGETIAPRELLATAMILGAVGLVMLPRRTSTSIPLRTPGKALPT